jgi:phosphoribosylformylglycinamidine synthase
VGTHEGHHRPEAEEDVPEGLLHPRHLRDGVHAGVIAGGNESGIPYGLGWEYFDERYLGKPLVYCGTVGTIPRKIHGRNGFEKEIEPGDLIVMSGGRIGKDGIHGATFSSAEIDENSPQSAVQIGSPITQKLVADFMQQAVIEGLIKSSTDNGAGGLSSSIGELAQISGGAKVELDKVPLKYENLKPWEIFISESQERMTFVVMPEKKDKLFQLANERDVEISVIGEFTDSGYLDISYNDKRVAYLNMEFLHDGVPRKYMEAEYSAPELTEPILPVINDYNNIMKRMMGSFNICSRENVIRQYDHEVKGKSIIKPLMGNEGKNPQDAAVMRLNFDDYSGVAISNGICPKFSDLDAYEMSAGAFDEAVRQIISVGGKLPELENDSNRFFYAKEFWIRVYQC